MLLNKKLPILFILNKIKIDILYVFIIAMVVYCFSYLFQVHLPEMPISIPAFMGTAISILLSFKLGQSYDRWWEARKIWGAIVNDSRTLVMQLQGFVKTNEKVVTKMAHRQIAWCYYLTYSLRGVKIDDETEKILAEDEIKDIQNHDNKPLALLQLHIRDLANLRKNEDIDVFEHLRLDETLQRFCASMGKAERIKSTIFPVTYRLYLHFIIYIFLVTLSFALAGISIFYKLPLLMVIATAFFLLEKTASYIQDPFSDRPTDTPMLAISRVIEINIRQLLHEDKVPEKYESNGYYLM
jgi:ion channel-forming bestrophin family protein